MAPIAIHAYHMAKIVINVGLNRRISEGDAHDAHHYAAACYADALVTQDAALKDTLNFIPNPSVGLLSFEEFAQELTRGFALVSRRRVVEIRVTGGHCFGGTH